VQPRLGAVALLCLLRPGHGGVSTAILGTPIAVIGVASGVLPTAQNHGISSLEDAESTVALSLNGSSSYLGLAIAGLAGGTALAGDHSWGSVSPPSASQRSRFWPSSSSLHERPCHEPSADHRRHRRQPRYRSGHLPEARRGEP